MSIQSKQMGQEASWEILCSLQKHNAFVETATGKSIFGSYYHVREPQTQKLSMTFGEYAQCIKQWTSKKLIFKVIHCKCMCSKIQSGKCA